jgi:hypothetical protein
MVKRNVAGVVDLVQPMMEQAAELRVHRWVFMAADELSGFSCGLFADWLQSTRVGSARRLAGKTSRESTVVAPLLTPHLGQ